MPQFIPQDAMRLTFFSSQWTHLLKSLNPGRFIKNSPFIKLLLHTVIRQDTSSCSEGQRRKTIYQLTGTTAQPDYSCSLA